VAPSEQMLSRLGRTNPTIVFLVALAVLMGGLFLPGIVGAALLFVLGAMMAALTYTTWSVQPPATRVIRVVLLVLVIAAVVAKIV
jgi:uncharacterized membrane protein